MQKFPHHIQEYAEVPKPQRKSAKGMFLAVCAILSGVYLIFSFALNAAYADPPTSPYTPGETLSPTCSPTSTNCTVLPPLFSTTTLPMGGILYMNDTSGTVTANTSSLYWNTAASQLQVGAALNASGTITQNGVSLLTTSTITIGGVFSSTFNLGAGLAISTTGTIFNAGVSTSTGGVLNTVPLWTSASQLGNSIITENTSSIQIFQAPQNSTSVPLLALGLQFQKGNASGTLLGGNVSSSYNGALMNFEVNSSSVFSVASSGALSINETSGTVINASSVPVSDIFHIGNASATAVNTANTNALSIFYVGGAGTGGIESAAQRIDMAPGASGTWSGLRIVGQSSTVAGVNENAIKIDPLASPGAGNETAIQIGANWDQALAILGGPMLNTSTPLLALGSSTQNLPNASGTYIGINTPASFNGSYLAFQNNSTTVFSVASSGALTLTNTPSSILYTNGGGLIGALGVGSGLSLSGGVLTATGGTGGGGPVSSGLNITTTTISYVEQLTATTTVIMAQGSIASTSIFKYTIPGNTLGTSGSFVRVNVFGTVQSVTHSLGWIMYYGGQVLASSTSGNLTTTGATWAGWSATFYLSNASGTTNNQIGEFNAQIGQGTGGTAVAGTAVESGGVGTVDSTANKLLEIDIRNGSATTESSTVNSVQAELVTATTTVVTGITGGVGTTATSSNGYFPYYVATSTLSATSSLFIATSTGNLSVGTTTTSTSLLYVAGVVQATGGFLGQCLSSGGFNGTSSGSCNMDLAESYPTLESTEAGDVVAIPMDATSSDATSAVAALERSRGGSDETVIGVVSTNPGLVFDNGKTYLSGENDVFTTSTEAVVALAGRVPVKVSASNGPIEPGDLLAASTITPGVAVLAIGPGTVIGEALQAYSGPDDSNATSTPKILVFINPHWAPGNGQNGSSSPWMPVGISSGGSQSVLGEVVQYVQAALENLGISINNGIATLQGIVAQTISTNELCVQGTCVNGSQFSAMVNNNGNVAPPPAPPAPASVPQAPTPVSPPSQNGSSTDNSDSTSPSSTDITDSNASSTDPSIVDIDQSSSIIIVPTSTPSSTDVAPPDDSSSTTDGS